jgi:hypothetical protein
MFNVVGGWQRLCTISYRFKNQKLIVACLTKFLNVNVDYNVWGMLTCCVFNECMKLIWYYYYLFVYTSCIYIYIYIYI